MSSCNLRLTKSNSIPKMFLTRDVQQKQNIIHYAIFNFLAALFLKNWFYLFNPLYLKFIISTYSQYKITRFFTFFSCCTSLRSVLTLTACLKFRWTIFQVLSNYVPSWDSIHRHTFFKTLLVLLKLVLWILL